MSVRFLMARGVALSVALAMRYLSAAERAVWRVGSIPMHGLPTYVEVIDGSRPGRPVVRVAVRPIWIAFMAVAMPAAWVRAWIFERVANLEPGPGVAFVLSRHPGNKPAVLTNSPLAAIENWTAPDAGISLPPVVAAHVGGVDVSAPIRDVSMSFSDGMAPPPHAIDSFLRCRSGVGLRSAPLVVLDGALQKREIHMPP